MRAVVVVALLWCACRGFCSDSDESFSDSASDGPKSDSGSNDDSQLEICELDLDSCELDFGTDGGDVPEPCELERGDFQPNSAAAAGGGGAAWWTGSGSHPRLNTDSSSLFDAAKGSIARVLVSKCDETWFRGVNRPDRCINNGNCFTGVICPSLVANGIVDRHGAMQNAIDTYYAIPSHSRHAHLLGRANAYRQARDRPACVLFTCRTISLDVDVCVCVCVCVCVRVCREERSTGESRRRAITACAVMRTHVGSARPNS